MEFKVVGVLSINTVAAHVLIESDWNLKKKDKPAGRRSRVSINRIRLEFKEHSRRKQRDCEAGINRIRLEFKVIPLGNIQILHLVLIESDWNLKSNDRDPYQHTSWSINRIRLEFKAGYR